MEESISEFYSELLPKHEINSLEVIEMNENLKLKIEKFVQHLMHNNFPFDTLCWALAELELIFEKGSKKYTERDVINRAEKIFDSDLDYQSICRLISRLKIYLEEINQYP